MVAISGNVSARVRSKYLIEKDGVERESAGLGDWLLSSGFGYNSGGSRLGRTTIRFC